MTRFHVSVAGIVLVVLVSAVPGVARAQTGQSTTQGFDAQRAAAEVAAQADLDRVKRGLQALPPVKFGVPAVEFHATAYGERKITFEDLMGTFNLINGPVPYAGMTHQEFMNMSHPKDLFSTAGITPRDMLQAALVNVAAQATINALKKSVQALREAKTQREIDAIRAQIDRELAALNAQVIK